MSDDVAAEQTPGFKVGEKKTLDEYHKLGEFMSDPTQHYRQSMVEERIWCMHGNTVAGIQMCTNSPSRKERVVCDIFVSLYVMATQAISPQFLVRTFKTSLTLDGFRPRR
jgi:hypothetical protein